MVHITKLGFDPLGDAKIDKKAVFHHFAFFFGLSLVVNRKQIKWIK